MADTRTCARCGKEFEPQREHARFCSTRCRVAWNKDNLNPDGWGAGNSSPDKERDPQTQTSALAWAVIGMRDIAQRLGRVRPLDGPQAFAVISEAVWWVTIVDATMVRYHQQVYDDALAGLDPRERERTEGTFGGLRFVRNRMGYHADHADFIRPAPDPNVLLAEWSWKSVRKPALGLMPARGRRWEMKRYSAYEEWLAGQTMGDTFGRAAGFLSLASDLAIGPEATADPDATPAAK